MLNNLAQSPQPMHGGYSGFEAMPADGVVLFEQAETVKPEEITTRKYESFADKPLNEQAPRTVKTALPLTVLGHERHISSLDSEVARHATHATAVILDLRDGAVNYNMQKQGLSQQGSRYAS